MQITPLHSLPVARTWVTLARCRTAVAAAFAGCDYASPAALERSAAAAYAAQFPPIRPTVTGTWHGPVIADAYHAPTDTFVGVLGRTDSHAFLFRNVFGVLDQCASAFLTIPHGADGAALFAYMNR